MALKNRIVAFVAGVLIGPGVVWAGLESATYISDLVASNPLSSDLASTADDHIRLLKSTIKTTFPNINGAVTVTDEQLNAITTNVGANPTGTVGLSAVNGSAVTYVRSDGAPALSQAIAPTWSAQHIFSLVGSSTDYPISLRSNLPGISLRESDGAANNQDWLFGAQGEQLFASATNSSGTGNNWLTVDRTASVIDRVSFPTDVSGSTDSEVYVGTDQSGTLSNVLMTIRTAQTSKYALNVVGAASAQPVIQVHNQGTSGDNNFIIFTTDATLAGNQRGTITYNRAGGLVAYNTTSADDLKKNIKPAKSARKVINCIKVVSHDWKDSDAHMDYWVTAGTLYPCAPWAVTYETTPQHDGKVDVSKLVPALIKYAQEQDARIARLEADVARRH